MPAKLVYALLEPGSSTELPLDPKSVRYVGVTNQTIEKRLRTHVADSKREKNRRCHWIQKKIKLGNLPIIVEIEKSTESWREREPYWINHYRSLGSDLVNSTDGGEGVRGYQYSKEELGRMRERNLGDCDVVYIDSRGRKLAGVVFKCLKCEKEFAGSLNAHKRRGGLKYCGNRCAMEHIKETGARIILGPGEYMISGGIRRAATKKRCSACGADFMSRKDMNVEFCSKSCSVTVRKKIAEGELFKVGASQRYRVVRINCDFCGGEFERIPSRVVEKNYCSAKCVSGYRDKRTGIMVKCATCEKEHYRIPFKIYASNKMFCSYPCAATGRAKNKREAAVNV